MNNARLLINASRPLSWVNTAYPFAAGYIMLGGGLSTIFIVGTIFFLIPYNLLMYGVNDVFDYESDMKNPRKGGVEGAVTPTKHHHLLLSSSFLLCVPFLIALIWLGNFTSGIVLVGVMFFVVAYSIKGLRFKERPFIDSVTSSLHFVGPLVFAYALLGAGEGAWLVALSFFFWGMASHAFGAVQDINPDRDASIHSIATAIGARQTVWFSFGLYVASSLVLLSTANTFLIVAGLLVLAYAVNVAPYLTLDDAHSAKANRGWKRFLKLNYAVGAAVTILCILSYK